MCVSVRVCACVCMCICLRVCAYVAATAAQSLGVLPLLSEQRIDARGQPANRDGAMPKLGTSDCVTEEEEGNSCLQAQVQLIKSLQLA